MSGNTTYLGIQYPTNVDYVKDGASAIQTVADGFDSAFAIPTYNAQTGTTYTFALSDIGKIVTASNAAASTYTIPPQSSVTWVADTTLSVTNLGAGVVTFAAGAGVTVTNTAQTLSQFQSASLVRTGSNAWTVVTNASAGAASSGLNLIKTYNFSSVAAISLDDNTFTSTYKNYKIILETSGLTILKMRLRASGADNTTSNYTKNVIVINGATLTGERSGPGTTWDLTAVAALADPMVTMELFSPQASAKTKGNYSSGAGTSETTTMGTFNFGLTTSFDSATYFPDTGTFSGTLSVYGYEN